ncbi:MAG: glycerophosphodiester phosphodiesterase [Lachnospiraceae bacterium]|nr:glycerophosphodiester phosphodiesterase [Lachnospiraceae bacterium]
MSRGKKMRPVLIIVLILIAAYLFMVCPNVNQKRKKRLRPFTETYVAHRGYFDNASDAPENSLAAFSKAVENGFAVELDVQLTSDRKLVVFHDSDLKRMCGDDRVLRECTYEELQKLTLANSQEKIPLFSEVLSVIDEKVPMVIEIKGEFEPDVIAVHLAKEMEGYQGIYCIESFRPKALMWYRKHHPEVLRGQLSTDAFRDKEGKRLNPIIKFVGTNMMCNFLAKPDFIAYNHKHVTQPAFLLCCWMFPVMRFAWTIKDQKELRRARKFFHVFIFDSFDPHIGKRKHMAK